jgi:hypothetical protein
MRNSTNETEHMRLHLISILLAVVTAVAGCTHYYKTTLANAQGQTVTCESTVKSGFEECVAGFKAQEFEEVPPTRPEQPPQ